MIHTDPTSKLSKLVVISYLLITFVIIAVSFIIISNLVIANSISPTLVQTHTTQLNIDNFNKILNQIKSSN
ncbi:MAG: hypothetical protein ACD_58C00172G0006 [uncultured bacterium]|nr:MAG: hypothetical protein ACD_58C00172G0006 [uncultured bacterium]